MTRTSSKRGLALAGALLVPLALAHPAGAATRCVGPGLGCSPTLQAALDAAQDGDVVQLGPGTFKGGVQITKSVTLAGAGASKTTIKGDGTGRVILVGEPLAAVQPTVRIEGVTVTGGLVRRAPDEYELPDPGISASGGGIYTPYGADGVPGSGADLTVVDSVVRGNRASPSAQYLVPQEFLPCPGDGCYFAGAYGGGIAANGPLKLVRTSVVGNRTGDVAGGPPLTSDADSAGVEAEGPLTMIDSRVANNDAVANGPAAREAAGAGVILRGAFASTITRSEISGNRGLLRSALPDEVEQLAIGGGLLVEDVAGKATIMGSQISGNVARAASSAGYVQAWSGGLHVNGTLDMRRTVVSRNVSSAGERNGTFDAYADSGGGEINGDDGDVSRVVDSSFLGNTTAATSGTGKATAGGGAIWSGALDPGSVAMTGSLVAGNRVIVTSRTEANASGGGIWTVGGFDLLRTKVLGNELQLHGPAGLARGGGIFAGRYADDPSLPLTPRLSLTLSDVGANRIVASRGITRLAGGVFSETPVALDRARIASNTPEPQCACGGAAQRSAPSAPATSGTPRHRGSASQAALAGRR